MKKINKRSKLYKSLSPLGCILSLNSDRGDAFWQTERGPRYGNARKAKAKAKRVQARKDRRTNQNWE